MIFSNWKKKYKKKIHSWSELVGAGQSWSELVAASIQPSMAFIAAV
jgi:hypothetical protein